MDINEQIADIKKTEFRWDFSSIEAKWQKRWEENQSFKAVDFSDKPKFYLLSEFFGPSGKGIHLGHVKCYTPTEIIARFMRFKGYNVLYPVGWDAFGLPTENYAIKMHKSPELVTKDNIAIFTNQLKKMGYSFDWSREFATTDSDYYKWTQWIFLQLFKNGMAYKNKGEVNFCPTCKTVLSNEDSQGGICDRCHNPVVKAERNVWYLRMKDYSEKMLDAVEEINMKPNLKESQRNWIGKSIGAEVDFAVKGTDKKFTVFTTRADTLFGVTFMVVSPEHEFIDELKDKIQNIDEVKAYAENAKHKSDIERTANKEKTGVKLQGVTAINPVNSKEIPIFVADYVLSGYGTGAIMAVPAHDQRDYDFAKKFGIDIIPVLEGGDDYETHPYEDDGVHINSEFLNGLGLKEAKAKITAWLEERKLGKEKVNYKMQDWPFNRQRYWGEPFPIVICDKCGYVPVPEEELPLLLPKTDDFTPDDTGNGPLSKLSDWVNCKCPKCGGKAKRETDTMPNWAGSSWYWLRFMDPHNDKEFVSQENLKYWGEADLYTGGVEHVTRHMLYASFWHNFLYDIGKLPKKLPFKRRMCNGLILDEKGRKMGKSSGNAVDPILVVNQFGADVFRLHVMFIGEYEQNTIWTFTGITGSVNFLNKVWDLQNLVKDGQVSAEHEKALHKLIKKVNDGIFNPDAKTYEDANDFKFNTIISSMMEFVNKIKDDGFISKEEYRAFLVLLNPFTPHITSEIYERVFGGDILNEKFPEYDESKTKDTEINLPVQLMGKMKGTIRVNVNLPKEEIQKMALEFLKIDGEPKKVIFVPGRIINIIM